MTTRSRAKTSILFLEKKTAPDDAGTQKETFFCIIGNSGYAPNGNPVPGNELPDALMDWRAFEAGKALGAHRDSWVGDLVDRMDAEFYRKRTTLARPVEEQIVLDGGELLALLTKTTSDLASITAEIKATFENIETVSIPLAAIFEPCEEVIKISPASPYKLLGVKWWGGGTFLREEKIGKEIKAQRLFKVQQGWVIYNRLFAFRGSFAIVPPDHDGCYVSGEFPTFKVRSNTRESKLLSNYVIHCLNSPQYLTEVDRDSTGSTKTSRNRFKEDRFLRMHVAIPKKVSQIRQLVDLLNKANLLRSRQNDISDSIKRFNDDLSRLLPNNQDSSITEHSDVEVFADRCPEDLLPTSTPGSKRKPRSSKSDLQNKFQKDATTEKNSTSSMRKEAKTISVKSKK